ncbi:MAG: BlaI/MecI/CopY family transcriptional regulator [Pirellulaceae bacterium]
MVKKKATHDLGRRERQIMDAIHQLQEASVGEVRECLPDPPSYSSVRTMIRHLESKGWLRHRSQGKKYVYRPTQKRESARRSALRHVMQTFFAGSAADTVASILGEHTGKLSDDDLDRLESIIEQARRDGK